MTVSGEKNGEQKVTHHSFRFDLSDSKSLEVPLVVERFLFFELKKVKSFLRSLCFECYISRNVSNVYSIRFSDKCDSSAVDKRWCMVSWTTGQRATSLMRYE